MSAILASSGNCVRNLVSKKALVFVPPKKPTTDKAYWDQQPCLWFALGLFGLFEGKAPSCITWFGWTSHSSRKNKATFSGHLMKVYVDAKDLRPSYPIVNSLMSYKSLRAGIGWLWALSGVLLQPEEHIKHCAVMPSLLICVVIPVRIRRVRTENYSELRALRYITLSSVS